VGPHERLLRKPVSSIPTGENGSGKSTLTKLLTRLHEPISGTVLIDGRPAQDFKRAELREATAALSQDHNLLSGLSVAEDVGLGRWQHRGDTALVARSLELGGAAAVVAKLAAGADTVLHPRYTKSCMGLTVGHPLSKYYEKLETWASVSGGEQQRLVACVPLPCSLPVLVTDGLAAHGLSCG
jgi:ABC-type multidrug transport system fused ATPase/permease subunit